MRQSKNEPDSTLEMIDMTSNNPVTFPEEIRQAWSQIKGVEPMIPKLEDVCSRIARAADFDPPGKIKKDLITLRDALRKLIAAAESMGYAAGCALPLEGSMSDDERLQQFAISSKHEMTASQGLASFFTDVRSMEHLASLAVQSQSAIQGRPKNIRARLMACLVKLVFDKHGVEATTYQDGAFYRVLDISFSLVLPELGPEAYRRYADWALKNTDQLIGLPNQYRVTTNSK